MYQIRFVGRTFRSDNECSGEGLLSPEASGAKAQNPPIIDVGAEAPTHKPSDSFVAGCGNRHTYT